MGQLDSTIRSCQGLNNHFINSLRLYAYAYDETACLVSRAACKLSGVKSQETDEPRDGLENKDEDVSPKRQSRIWQVYLPASVLDDGCHRHGHLHMLRDSKVQLAKSRARGSFEYLHCDYYA